MSIFFAVFLNYIYVNLQVYLLSILLPMPLEGKGRGERAAVWCLVAGCQVKEQHKYIMMTVIICLTVGPREIRR